MSEPAEWPGGTPAAVVFDADETLLDLRPAVTGALVALEPTKA